MTTWSVLADAVADRVSGSREADERPTHGEGDRVTDPAETLEIVRRLAPALGITRIGLVTGLDTLGIPIAAAYRPNSRSLSVNQGKGRDTVSALVSAAMEAAEVAIAERVPARALHLSPTDVTAAGVPLLDLSRVTRCRWRSVDKTVPRTFVAGFDLVTGRALDIPYVLVGLAPTDLPDGESFDRSSDGLASGNRLAEAILRGLMELVERDAVALMELLPDAALVPLKRDPAWFGDAFVSDAVVRLDRAGVDVALLDATSDFRLPVVAALLTPRAMERRPGAIEAGITIGYGCDFTFGAAAVRAITEAAQARVTAIAGARDDIGSDRYAAIGAGDAARQGRLAALTAAVPPEVPPAERRARFDCLWTAIDHVVTCVAARGIREVVVVPLTAPDEPVQVCRVVVPGLEVGGGGQGRQPGARMIRAMLKGAA